MHYNDYSILVVDDDATNRAILGGCLAKEGYNVAEAHNGTEATELIKTEQFDLMLLDIMMPDVDGFQVLESVRRDPRNKRMHVMMTTGSKEAANVTRSIRLGAEEYIVKPYDLPNIRTRIWRCLTKDAAHKRTANPGARAAAARVALLDVNPVAQQSITRILDADGNKVTILSGESDVLNGVETGQFDIVLLDLTPLEADGFALIEKIRQQKNSIPVVVVSSDEKQETPRRCMVLGAADYLLKPYHASALRNRVHDCLARHTQRKIKGA